MAAVAIIILAVAVLLWFLRRKRRTDFNARFPSVQPVVIRRGEKDVLNEPIDSSDIVTPRPYTQFYEAPSRSDVSPAVAASSIDALLPHASGGPSGSQITSVPLSRTPPHPSESQVSSTSSESPRRQRADVNIEEIMERLAQRIDVPRDENATLPQYRE